MTREFVRTREFEKCWKRMKLTEQHLMALESYLCTNPMAGDVVQGTGDLRKLRWALPDTGKSGGIRVVYVDFTYYEKIYFFSAYPKSQKLNLTNEERKFMKQYINAIGDELKRK